MKKCLAIVLALLGAPIEAQTPSPPISFPVIHAFDSNGNPLEGGQLYSYVAVTTTPQATYNDASGNMAHPNPVILDATDPAKVFVANAANKFVLQNQFGAQQRTVDNIVGSSQAASSLQRVFSVDQFCNTAGTYDQTCLANAIAAAGNNSKIVLNPHTYNFASQVKVSALNNVDIEGSVGSVIVEDGISIECDRCTNVVFKDIQFQTVTQPVVVVQSSLPTPNPSTVVAIDRWGSGEGYVPTGNDNDIVPVVSGGTCTSSCLSAAQSSENFDTGLLLRNPVGCEVLGSTGKWYSIVVMDGQNCHIHNNFVYGGKGQASANLGAGPNQGGGAILFWMTTATGGVFTNLGNTVENNTILNAAFDGVTIAHGNGNVISGNIARRVGESGFKTWEGNGYYSKFTSVTGNVAEYSWFDGFDIGATYPANGTIYTHDSITGNVSIGNHGTGYIGDGNGVSFTSNTASNNVHTGFLLDYGNGTISNNVGINNNTGNDPGQGQMMVGFFTGVGNNVIYGNSFLTSGGTGSNGYGMNVVVGGGVPTSTVSKNLITGGLPIVFNIATTLTITNTAMTSGTATYSYSLLNGALPRVGELVTVRGTTNGSGVFNVRNAVIVRVTGTSSGTFTVTGLTGTFTSQSETGSAHVSCATCSPIQNRDNIDNSAGSTHL